MTAGRLANRRMELRGGDQVLSASQCEAFESQGYILQPDVLSPRELAEARATW